MAEYYTIFFRSVSAAFAASIEEIGSSKKSQDNPTAEFRIIAQKRFDVSSNYKTTSAARR
jgi:hypothetical protein